MAKLRGEVHLWWLTPAAMIWMETSFQPSNLRAKHKESRNCVLLTRCCPCEALLTKCEDELRLWSVSGSVQSFHSWWQPEMYFLEESHVHMWHLPSFLIHVLDDFVTVVHQHSVSYYVGWATSPAIFSSTIHSTQALHDLEADINSIAL